MKAFSLAWMIGAVALSGAAAMAQVSEQIVVTPGATTTTTTVQTPGDAITTQVTSTPGHSMKTRLKDGSAIELDSDGFVYTVFSDGARVAAPDGVHTLMDGSTITVKDGKRIP